MGRINQSRYIGSIVSLALLAEAAACRTLVRSVITGSSVSLFGGKAEWWVESIRALVGSIASLLLVRLRLDLQNRLDSSEQRSLYYQSII